MACGTPAVVYDNTAQPELVTPETGIVVETGNIKAVKRAVEKICAKPKNDYLKDTRNRAATYYDKEKQFLNYLRIYDSLLP